MKCPVCFRHCDLGPGQIGFCRARMEKDGKSVCRNYGAFTSLALDPIEKKPLKLFHPGSLILSVGSYGCNLRCPFCQNYEISQRDLSKNTEVYSPRDLVAEAARLTKEGNIGIAYTYNEPMVSFEFVRDCGKLAHEKGLLNVLVTNGCASLEALDEVLPCMDAMNIDLKGFSDEFYRFVGGDFSMVKDFIEEASKKCHVELTTLVIPNHNDSPELMEQEARWIASLDSNIALHITRYFPRYQMKEAPTSLESLESLASVARRYLKNVFIGNV
jgi:pyruvate formate lyase activating enzyme